LSGTLYVYGIPRRCDQYHTLVYFFIDFYFFSHYIGAQSANGMTEQDLNFVHSCIGSGKSKQVTAKPACGTGARNKYTIKHLSVGQR